MAQYRETDLEPTPFTGDVPVPTGVSLPRPGKPMGRINRVAAQLLGLGYSVEEVSRDTNLPVTHLKVLLRSRLFQTEMDRARERFITSAAADIRTRIYDKAPAAFAAVSDIIDNPSHPQRLAAAKEVLDRVVPRAADGSRAEPTIVINISEAKLASVNATLAEYETLNEGDSSPVERPSPPSGGDPGGRLDDSEIEDDGGD